jgi:hypothetical protein
MNIPTFLISHGSHTESENITAQYEMDQLANGLLTSNFATQAIIQSPLSEKIAMRLTPELTRRNVHPVMWGSHMTHNSKRQNALFTILHASTFKVLGSRPWIYENSNEFVYGLQHLIMAIKNMKNVQLILRVQKGRHECSNITLKKLLPKSTNFEFSTADTFEADLEKSDMLISFSSTAIEQALIAKKPVGLFGGSSRYYHLPGNLYPPTMNHRSAVYHLNTENLQKMLASIAIVHRDKQLTVDELRPYIWGDNVLSRNDFIESLI